jgi:hypothetical protein
VIIQDLTPKTPKTQTPKTQTPKTPLLFRLFLTKVSLLLLFLVILLLAPCVSAVEGTGAKTSQEWKEVVIDLPDQPSNVIWYEWCGSDNKKLIAELRDNERRTVYFGLIDAETGGIEAIRESPVPLNPSCSPDGRYVFFQKRPPGTPVDLRRRMGQKTLYAYDTHTNKTSLIYDSDRQSSVRALEEPMSPCGRYLIGPEDWQEKVMLPGGEEVRIVHLPAVTKDGVRSEFGDVRWALDGSRLFLYVHEDRNVCILDPETGKQTTIPIEIKGALLKKYVRPAPDGARIYVTGYFGTFVEGTANLYCIDLKNPNKPPRLLIRDIDDYGVGADGMIIFGRHNIHPQEKGNFAHGIYLYDKQGKTTLLKEIPDRVGAMAYVYLRVSRDGKAVAYPRKVSKIKEVMTVLIRTEKN